MWWKKLCTHTHEQIHSRRHARTHAYHGIKYQYVNSALHWFFVDGVTRWKWRQNLSTLDEPCSTDTHSHSHRGPERPTERPTDRPTNLNNRIKCSLSIFCVCTLYLLWWWYASVSNVRRCSFFLFFFFVFFDFVFHSRSRSRSRFCHFNSFESSGCCCCLCLVRWYDSAFTLAGSISATSRSFRRRSSLPCTVTFMFDWLSGGSVRGAYSIVPFNFYAFFTHLIDSIDTESHFSVRWVVSVSVRPCPCISPISQLTENNFSLNYAISFHFICVQVYMDGHYPPCCYTHSIKHYHFRMSK